MDKREKLFLYPIMDPGVPWKENIPASNVSQPGWIEWVPASKITDLESQLAAQAKVVEAAKGFRDHGEAKHGTHGTILFKALAQLSDGDEVKK